MSIERGKVGKETALEKRGIPPEVCLINSLWDDEVPKLVASAPRSLDKKDTTRTEDLFSRQYFENAAGLPALRDTVARMKENGKTEEISEEAGWKRHTVLKGHEDFSIVLDITLQKEDDSSRLAIDYWDGKKRDEETVRAHYEDTSQPGKNKQEIDLFVRNSPAGSPKDESNFAVSLKISRTEDNTMTTVQSHLSKHNETSQNSVSVTSSNQAVSKEA